MSSPPRRRIDLDLLRALAVGLVIVHHMAMPEGLPEWASVPLAAVKKNGGFGVDLFFVLSGFLVSGLLFSEIERRGTFDFWRFFVRRGFKIYPPFYVFLIVVIGVTIARTSTVALPNALSEATFMQAYGFQLMGHTWTLSVEEHFYLFLPALLWVFVADVPKRVGRIVTAFMMLVAVAGVGAAFYLGRAHSPLIANLMAAPFAFALYLLIAHWLRRDERQRLAGLPLATLVIALLALGLRIYAAIVFRRPPYENVVSVRPSYLRIDALLFGTLLSFYYRFARASLQSFVQRCQWWLLPLATALIVPILVISTDWIRESLALTGLYLGVGIWLIWIVLNEERFTRFYEWRLVGAIATIGSYSYSIYLWHYAILSWLPPPEKFDQNLGIVIYLVMSVIGGVVLAKLIEIPSLRIRDRLAPSRS